MQVMASSDGTSCLNVRPRMPTICPPERPSISARESAPRNTAVPGIAKTLRSITAASGVGIGRDRRHFEHDVVQPGERERERRDVEYGLVAGRPHRKMQIDARMNGDQPFSTATAECCGVSGVALADRSGGDLLDPRRLARP